MVYLGRILFQLVVIGVTFFLLLLATTPFETIVISGLVLIHQRLTIFARGLSSALILTNTMLLEGINAIRHKIKDPEYDHMATDSMKTMAKDQQQEPILLLIDVIALGIIFLLSVGEAVTNIQLIRRLT